MERRKRDVEMVGTSDPPRAKVLRTSSAQSVGPPVDGDITPDDVLVLQRAQLAALVEDQRRDLKWMNGKLEEMQQLVAVLDAAPRAALYHMDAVREDLAGTLAALGLAGDLGNEQSALAARMLDHEVVTNESLGDAPAALRELSAKIISALKDGTKSDDADVEASKEAYRDLQARFRSVSDQLERYAERDKQTLVSSTTLRDELEDCKSLNAMRRNRITALELAVHSNGHDQAVSGLQRSNGNSGPANGDVAGGQEVNSTSAPRSRNSPDDEDAGDSKADEKKENWEEKALEASQLSEQRLQELVEMQDQCKDQLAKILRLEAQIGKRDSGIVPIGTVIKSALYQTMEATLQQLYLKERKWEQERTSVAEEREEERKEAQELLEGEKEAKQQLSDLYTKQIEELRRSADAAKAEKDKVMMTYEARKMESGSLQTTKMAYEKRLTLGDEVRTNLEAKNAALKEEVEQFKAQLTKCQDVMYANAKQTDVQELVSSVKVELENERKKSSGFINEVESLSMMYGELESENSRIQKLLVEKEQVLSKVMSERLRARQQLTTVKEENRALAQGRTTDQERIKQLAEALSCNKQLVKAANHSSNKAMEETRMMSGQLEKRQRIADEASVSARTAIAEREEMKVERDALASMIESSAVDAQGNKFDVRRLTEENRELKKRLMSLEESVRPNEKKAANGEAVRDEIIRELTKKLNCSVMTNCRKEVVLTRCGHLFSKKCTDNLIATRNRKCPICGRAFGLDDVQMIFF